MRKLITIALAAALCASAGAARAAAPAAKADGSIVEELVVTAAHPSPAWWQVTKGEATVWILGGPMGPVPKDVRWNDAPLKKRIAAAETLILPSGATVSFSDVFSLLRLRGQLKEKSPLEASLPTALAARFAAARTALGKPADRYDGWTPVWAGRLLQQDYFDRWRLRGGASAVAEARAAASQAHVKVERVTRKALPVLKSAAQEMRQEDKALLCLGGYLEAVETPPQRYRSAATAWAQGEVRGAIDLPRGADICREAIMDEFASSSINDQVAAISEALESGGTAVAIVPLRQLLVRDGVLQRLKRRGFEIIDPANLVEN